MYVCRKIRDQMSLYLSIHLSIYPSIHLSICLLAHSRRRWSVVSGNGRSFLKSAYMEGDRWEDLARICCHWHVMGVSLKPSGLDGILQLGQVGGTLLSYLLITCLPITVMSAGVSLFLSFFPACTFPASCYTSTSTMQTLLSPEWSRFWLAGVYGRRSQGLPLLCSCCLQ